MTQNVIAPGPRGNVQKPAEPQDRPPSRLTSVFLALPFLPRGTPDQRRKYGMAFRNAHQRAADRKARVAAHPDLAERLRRALRYRTFDQWTGFVPPTRDAEGNLNPSPVRAELIAILREIARREGSQDGHQAGR